MPRSFKSIHELLQHIYLNGGARVPHAREVLLFARLVFDQTEIGKHIEKAIVLERHTRRAFLASPGDPEPRELYKILWSFFRPIVDDLLLCSAFEMWAKATLLKRGYVIHEIGAPSRLRTAQRASPVHIECVRKAQRNGEKVSFSDKTIAASRLITPGYVAILAIPADVVSGMTKIISRRNMAHLLTSFAWPVDAPLLATVSFLQEKIPGEKKA